MRRTLFVAAACGTILIGVPASAQPLVSLGDVSFNFGDIDVLDDVLEHITILGTSQPGAENVKTDNLR